MVKDINVLQDAYDAVAHLCRERAARRVVCPSADPLDDFYASVADTRLCLGLQAGLDAGRTAVSDRVSPKLQAFLQECNLIQ